MQARCSRRRHRVWRFELAPCRFFAHATEPTSSRRRVGKYTERATRLAVASTRRHPREASRLERSAAFWVFWMRGVKHRWLNPLQKQLVFRCNQIVHAEYPFIVHARPCAFPATVGTRYRWSPLGRTCSGHPRLPGRCRSRVQKRGWPEQVRPRGSRVLSSAL